MSSGLTPGERGTARSMKSWPDIVASPMEAAPGAHYVYGPYHVNAFGLALERKLKGETFEAYLKRRILDPLKIAVDWRMRCADGHPQLAFESDDVDAAFARVVEAGGTILNSPSERPWRQTLGHVRDLNGFVVEIGTPQTGDWDA